MARIWKRGYVTKYASGSARSLADLSIQFPGATRYPRSGKWHSCQHTKVIHRYMHAYTHMYRRWSPCRHSPYLRHTQAEVNTHGNAWVIQADKFLLIRSGKQLREGRRPFQGFPVHCSLNATINQGLFCNQLLQRDTSPAKWPFSGQAPRCAQQTVQKPLLWNPPDFHLESLKYAKKSQAFPKAY